jgi:hypothetical protein
MKFQGQRIAQIARLKPEFVKEYKDCHARVWPEVLRQIRECNIEDCMFLSPSSTPRGFPLGFSFSRLPRCGELRKAKVEGIPLVC